jgi:quercetin dioxygenase-like cupin family protein
MASPRKKPAAIGMKAAYPGFIEPALATSINKVPSGERWVHEIKFEGGVTYERLVPVAAGNLLEANVHVVAAGGEKVDLVTHQGEAVGYLVSGTIELTIDDTTYLMTPGDSFFKAYLTNSYRNVGQDEARIVWVNTPQVH